MPAKPMDEVTILGRVRAKGISTSTLSDCDLYTLIQDALDEYMFYKPKLSITSMANCITTVANQPNYSLPDDALWVISVAWHPDYSSDLNDVYRELLMSTMGSNSISVVEIYYQKLAALHNIYGGKWKLVDGEIWLIPEPNSSGVKVPVFYASEKTLEELDQIGDYRFLDLVYYKALHSVGMAKTIGGGWRAGAYATNEAVGRETLRSANMGLDRTRALLANSYTGRHS